MRGVSLLLWAGLAISALALSGCSSGPSEDTQAAPSLSVTVPTAPPAPPPPPPFTYDNRTGTLVSMDLAGTNQVNPMGPVDGSVVLFALPAGTLALRLELAAQGTLPASSELHMHIQPPGCAQSGTVPPPCETLVTTTGGKGEAEFTAPTAGQWRVQFFLSGTGANQVTYTLAIATQG